MASGDVLRAGRHVWKGVWLPLAIPLKHVTRGHITAINNIHLWH